MNIPTNLMNLEVNQYEDLPAISRKTSRAIIVGYADSNTVEAAFHGVALMMNHGEPTPEIEAQMLRTAHLLKAAAPLLRALEHAQNRLETIREAHPEIDLDDTIAIAKAAIMEATQTSWTWDEALEICKARGEWTPGMEAMWGSGANQGGTP